jgi:nonsense-mediated mRNA decay protein 3
MILCCKCGIAIQPKLMNMCDRCLTAEITISSKVKRSMLVEHCRACGRYLCPPKEWRGFAWGSREFLLFLVKRNKTLGALEIVDSSFVHTEQSSKRVMLDLVVLQSGVEQPLRIRYTIRNHQCPDCTKTEAQQFWNNLVQVRHRAEHRRMLIYLEQLILKHNVYDDVTNIKQRKGGIDFYYTEKAGAHRMVNFLQGVLPVRLKTSERLLSRDVHNSKNNYKFTYSVEIVPLCKDDLVLMDGALADSLGVGTMLLVQKIASSITFVDPRLLKSFKMTAAAYWSSRNRIKVVMSSGSFTRYTVVVKEECALMSKEFAACDLTVSSNENDFIMCRSHLGRLVQEDDVVLGYDLKHANLAVDLSGMPEAVLVRREPKAGVEWKIAVERDDAYEYRLFVEDIENDREMLSNIVVVKEDDRFAGELGTLSVS